MARIKYYNKTTSSWEYADTGGASNNNFLEKSGDTMTGSLILAADPTDKLEATTKQYVDNAIKTAIGLAIGGSY